MRQSLCTLTVKYLRISLGMSLRLEVPLKLEYTRESFIVAVELTSGHRQVA